MMGFADIGLQVIAVSCVRAFYLSSGMIESLKTTFFLIGNHSLESHVSMVITFCKYLHLICFIKFIQSPLYVYKSSKT